MPGNPHNDKQRPPTCLAASIGRDMPRDSLPVSRRLLAGRPGHDMVGVALFSGKTTTCMFFLGINGGFVLKFINTASTSEYKLKFIFDYVTFAELFR